MSIATINDKSSANPSLLKNALIFSSLYIRFSMIVVKLNQACMLAG